MGFTAEMSNIVIILRNVIFEMLYISELKFICFKC